MIAIRNARQGDLTGLNALMWRASWANVSDRDFLSENKDKVRVPADLITAGQVFMAEEIGQLVGFASVQQSNGEWDLEGLFVEPTAMRRGIGRALLDHAAEAVRTRGGTSLYVDRNPHAEAFYRATGFVDFGPMQAEGGPGTRMRLDF